MNYMNNMNISMRLANRFSLNQYQHKAWDNVKRKTRKRCLPRGKVFERMEKMERKAWWDETKEFIDTYTS